MSHSYKDNPNSTLQLSDIAHSNFIIAYLLPASSNIVRNVIRHAYSWRPALEAPPAS